MPRVWMIEDNALFRRATVRALSARPGFESIRAFDRCETALAALGGTGGGGEQPEVLLLDVGLPGMSGLDGIGEFKQRVPALAILVLTVFEDDAKIFRAICAGASGYLLKSEPLDRLVEAIEQAHAGGSPMNPRVARRVLEMFSKLAPVPKDYGLTDRETAVLERMVAGRSKKEIADQLSLNHHTTDYVMRCIYRKLHVNCAAAAVSVALKDGLVA